MRPCLIRATQVLAIGMFCAGLWSESSHAEKMSPATLRQLCKTAGGSFFRARTGHYACWFPSAVDMAYREVVEDIYCTPQGDCERVTLCDNRVCERKPRPDKRNEKNPGPKPKPTKLEGALTAGTADQRVSGTNGGGTTAGTLNPNLGVGAAPTTSSLAGSTGSASGIPAAPPKSAAGINKPSMIPPQLAERLRRLQQPQH